MSTTFILRICVAAVLGGIIGLDREYRAKGAGFRTHFLVALGSALFMIVSQWGFEEIRGTGGVRLDPSRVAAQVVSGIGFIGAGTIIFQKHMLRGLTTAAGIWCTSAIGLACGAGMYVVALVTTLLALLCLEAFNYFLQRVGDHSVLVRLTVPSRQAVAQTVALMERHDIVVDSLETQTTDEGQSVQMDIRTRRSMDLGALSHLLDQVEGVGIVEYRRTTG